jgi:hypothetical protein
MLDIEANPRAVAGGNNPPEPTPYEAIKIHIDDLMETAQGFLDGDPITTQGVADEVGRLLAAARDAEKAAEAQRKVEAKPFDDGKAAVQALWVPLKDRCGLVASTAKRALAPYLAAEQARIEAEAATARKIAEDKAAAAQEALRAASATDLAALEQAEALLKDATKAGKAADRAGKDTAKVAGGARATSLRTYYVATISDRRAALAHYMVAQPDALTEWLLEQAQRDVNAGSRAIPGITINEEKRAV